MQKIEYISLSITQSYFKVSNDIRLNSTHYLKTKNHNKREKQYIDYKDIFKKIYRNCTKKPYSFFTIYTTLPAENPMRLRKNYSDSTL